MKDTFLNINLEPVANNLSKVIRDFTSFISSIRIDETVITVDEFVS